MKRSSGLKDGRCCHPSRQRWKDFCPKEFQPYQHLQRATNPDAIGHAPFPPNSVCSSLLRLDYSGGKAVYTCELCQVEIASAKEFEPATNLLQEHCNTNSHQRNFTVLRKMQLSTTKMACGQLQRFMDRLPPALWQMKVQHKLFQWLLNEPSNGDTSDIVEQESALHDVVISQENKEKQYLLELATWKALCITSTTSCIENGVHDVDSWNAWKANGWKALKECKRDSNEIGVVVKSVLPFLGISLDVEEDYNDGGEEASTAFSPSDFAHYMATETIPDGDFHHYSVMPVTTSGVRCDVCNVHIGPVGKAHRHRKEAEHLDRMKRVVDLQKCPIKVWCANIKHRLESSSREREATPWTLEVYSMLFWFLMGYTAWTDRQVESRKQDILNLLYEHEQHERMMMLRLAVWKSACVQNPIQEDNAEVQDQSYWDWANWARHGWKRRKLSTPRNSVEINAILDCVQSFLAKETAMSCK